MPLNKQKLATDLQNTMNQAKDQGWTVEQVAQAMASAIDAFVRGGDVTGVQSSVTVEGQNGSGTQSNTVHLQ